jgi:CheY-specific phosphatase CheX
VSASDTKDLLESAVREVLEIMFLTEVSDRAATRPGPPSVYARLGFRGNPSGQFTLEVTRSGAHKLAANFLGLPPDLVTQAQAGDVICELASMVCGSALSRIESETTFDLTQPQLLNTVPEPQAGEASCAFSLKEGSLAARIAFEAALT